jgi:phage tail tape-measure protein
MNRKELYVQHLEGKMKEWEAEMDKLSARLDQAEAKNRLELKKRIESIDREKEKVKIRLKELRDSGKDAWEEMRAGVQAAWNELEKSMKNVKDAFQ